MAVVLWVIAGLIFPHLAAAQTYRYVDPNGVVSFTDDLGKVPESQRPQVLESQPSSAPPLSLPSVREAAFGTERRGPARSLLGPLIMLIGLSALMVYVQRRTDSLLLRLAVKLLFIGFLGVLVYTTLIKGEKSSLERQAREISANAHGIQERLNAHDAALDANGSAPPERPADTGR